MKRREFLWSAPALSTGLVVATAGCLASGDDYDVGMQSNAFVPRDVEARVGEPVVWLNTGSRNHTVTGYERTLPDGASYFASGGFASEQAARDGWAENVEGGGTIRPGERYAHTFEVPGTYAYFCIPHEPAGMVGSVTVTE